MEKPAWDFEICAIQGDHITVKLRHVNEFDIDRVALNIHCRMADIILCHFFLSAFWSSVLPKLIGSKFRVHSLKVTTI
jgi:hypothetical protein